MPSIQEAPSGSEEDCTSLHSYFGYEKPNSRKRGHPWGWQTPSILDSVQSLQRHAALAARFCPRSTAQRYGCWRDRWHGSWLRPTPKMPSVHHLQDWGTKCKRLPSLRDLLVPACGASLPLGNHPLKFKLWVENLSVCVWWWWWGKIYNIAQKINNYVQYRFCLDTQIMLHQ